MEGALTARQTVNEGDSSLATELQEEPEENPGPVVDENIVSAKKQGPSTHNWSGDWSFWSHRVTRRRTTRVVDLQGTGFLAPYVPMGGAAVITKAVAQLLEGV